MILLFFMGIFLIAIGLLILMSEDVRLEEKSRLNERSMSGDASRGRRGPTRIEGEIYGNEGDFQKEEAAAPKESEGLAGKTEIRGGGVVMIGPLPIVFGSDARYALILMIAALALMLLWAVADL